MAGETASINPQVGGTGRFVAEADRKVVSVCNSLKVIGACHERSLDAKTGAQPIQNITKILLGYLLWGIRDEHHHDSF